MSSSQLLMWMSVMWTNHESLLYRGSVKVTGEVTSSLLSEEEVDIRDNTVRSLIITMCQIIFCKYKSSSKI